MRNVLAKLGMILFGLVLALVAVEIFLRIMPVANRFELDRQLAAQWESDPELLLHLKPNLNLTISAHPEFTYTVQTNAEGLREEALAADYDVAAIGDSFTFGFGVDAVDSWPSKLETISDLRVVNLGWAGWNSYVYPAAIRRYASPLDAEVWVWAFFSNDLTESTGAADYIASGGTDFYADQRQEPALPFPLNLRLAETLMVLLNPEYRLLPNSGTQVFDNGDLQMLISDYGWTMTDPDNPEVQRGWALTEAALAETQDLAEAHGARLLVAFIPTREHVYWPVIADAVSGHDVSQLDAAETRLASICAEIGADYINLLPGLREAAGTDQMLYFPGDGHWNAAGHAVVAQLIYAAIGDAAGAS